MALCNSAPRDASAFSAHPRSCSGSAGLMGQPRWSSPGHNRTHIGVCLLDTNRRAALARILLDGSATLDATQAAIGHRAAIRPAELRVSLAFVMLALHPCQQAASHLACTRPPDFVVSRCSFLVLPPTSSSSSSRSATPARWALLAGRRAVAHGLRATCIRRAESSGGLLATSFGGLQHFQGPHILYGRPSSPA